MFHGPVSLPYLAILNYLPISAYIGLLNIARLDQLFTQSDRRGHPCILDTVLVLYKSVLIAPAPHSTFDTRRSSRVGPAYHWEEEEVPKCLVTFYSNG